jgi:hypothetical protein
LENTLEKVNFKDAGQYYNDIVGKTACFDVSKSDTELIKIMAKKVNSALYAMVILEHLSSTNLVTWLLCALRLERFDV